MSINRKRRRRRQKGGNWNQRTSVKSPSSDRDRGVVGILNNSWDLIGEMMDASHEKKPRRSITAHIWIEVDGVWYRQWPNQKISIRCKGNGWWTPYPIRDGQSPIRVYQPVGWEGPDYALDLYDGPPEGYA